jgi:hypothetical protein
MNAAHARLAARGTYQISDQWSYKTLMVIQYSLPAILLAGSAFFPESAYYLIKKGEIQAAERALKRTHGSKDPTLLDIELKRLTENVRFSEQLKKEAAIGGPLLYQCFRETNLVSVILNWLIPETYLDRDRSDNCTPTHGSVLFRWLYATLYSLTLDVTYFFELIGITQAFDITCAVFAVNIAATMAAFGLIEVRKSYSRMTVFRWWVAVL